MLSYLHIVFQPIMIKLIAMELVPKPVRQRVRGWVLGLCAGTSAIMLLQLVPVHALGMVERDCLDCIVSSRGYLLKSTGSFASRKSACVVAPITKS